MKRSVLILLITGFGMWMSNISPVNALNRKSGPVIKFDEMTHDFGTLKEGDVVNYVFTFTNSGNAPLIIEDVEQPCGCTIPKWGKAPIMPGQKGQIKVIFNSKERPGIFRKTLMVKTNAPMNPKDPLMLMIKGNVLTRKQWKEAHATDRKTSNYVNKK